jgi:hypothetical protein
MLRPDFSCAEADAVIIANAIIVNSFFIVFFLLFFDFSMFRYFDVSMFRSFEITRALPTLPKDAPSAPPLRRVPSW